MKVLPGGSLQESGKLESTHRWVELLDFSLPYGRHWRIANDLTPVTYHGETYEASAFTPEIIALNEDTPMPVFTLSISGLEGRLDPWLSRPGGLEGQDLTAAVVDVLDLDGDFSDTTVTYQIRGHVHRGEAIDFEVGGPNLYNFTFPCRRYLPTLCEVEFKGALCGYVGPETACTYTLADCRRMGNAARFGASPGMRTNSLRVVG